MVAVKRKYKVSDAFLVEYAKDMRNLFNDDLADFNDFDADFNTDLADDWLENILAAQIFLRDRSVVAYQKGCTYRVEKAMKRCRKYYQEVKFFVLKTFPDDISIQNEFGLSTYDEIRKSQTKLLEFMRDVYNVAGKYAAKLAAKNFDAASIADINILADALEQANLDQNISIKGRLAITSNRIAAYNKVWATVTLVSRASKIIYADDAVKYNQYILPAGNESEGVLKLKGKVTDAAPGRPIKNAQVSIDGLKIKVKTDSKGQYGIGNIKPGSYKLACFANKYHTLTLDKITVVNDRTTVQNFTLTLDTS